MVFCSFLNKGSSKAPQKIFGKNPDQKLFAKTIEEIFGKNPDQKLVSCYFFLSIFLSRFWPFLCMKSLKRPCCSKRLS
jgi:hypothetical protein